MTLHGLVVDRLQKLVNVLVDARLETITSPPTSSVSPRSPRSSISVPPVPECVLPPLNEQDLAERLFNLTISSFSMDSTSTPPSKEFPTRRVELIDEVSLSCSFLVKQRILRLLERRLRNYSKVFQQN